MESNLSVVVSDRQDATVLAVSGELDMASSPQLIEALAQVDEAAGGRLVLDLTELQFVDVAGMRVLLAARERAGRMGSELVLVNVRDEVQRVLEITGATELLENIE
jgi:anti-sigma B factor antagonist